MPTLSIAMATYNGAAYLREQLESLEAQTRRPDEIVITDDNSSDGTAGVVEAFRATSRIDVKLHVNPQNLGFRGNFMRAASLCGSDLIGFCDQDDVWDSNKIERCLAPFSDPDLLLCHHDARIVNDALENIGSLHNEGLGRTPVRANMMRSLWSSPRGFTQVFRAGLMELAPFRRHSLDHNVGGDEMMAHDQWTYLVATSFGKTVFLDEQLASYRQHSGNVVGVNASDQRSHLVSQAANGGREFSRRRDAALGRAQALRAAASSLSPAHRGLNVKQALDIADLYEDLAEVYRRRAGIYAPDNEEAPIAALLKNLAGGWYVGWKTPRLGMAPLVKDALFATVWAGRRS